MSHVERLPKVIEVDLDFTLCEPDYSSDDVVLRYAFAKPMQEVIEQLRRAKSLGYEIVIRTARGMLSAAGNEQLFSSIKLVTLQWLKENEVPYDEIEFGKRSMRALVDDLALRPGELEGWLDDRTREVYGPGVFDEA